MPKRKPTRRPSPRIPEGFPGQRMVVLPRPVVHQAGADPLLANLLVTSIGYFPHANGHYINRPQGVPQAILIYCVRGSGWCELAGTRCNMRAGELAVVPPNVPHCYGADENNPWTIYWAHVTGHQVRLLAAAFAQIPANATPCHIGEALPVINLFDEVYRLMAESFGRNNLIAAALCAGHLWGEILHRQRSSQHQSESAAARLEHTLAFMRTRISGHITVRELAAAANLSEAHFTALFKQRTGFSALNYFIRLKMTQACHLLDTTPMSIKAIAVELGFQDSLYFSRQFHGIYELSPKAYRAIKKG